MMEILPTGIVNLLHLTCVVHTTTPQIRLKRCKKEMVLRYYTIQNNVENHSFCLNINFHYNLTSALKLLFQTV